jgi:hypothetical protein
MGLWLIELLSCRLWLAVSIHDPSKKRIVHSNIERFPVHAKTAFSFTPSFNNLLYRVHLTSVVGLTNCLLLMLAQSVCLVFLFDFPCQPHTPSHSNKFSKANLDRMWMTSCANTPSSHFRFNLISQMTESRPLRLPRIPHPHVHRYFIYFC